VEITNVKVMLSVRRDARVLAFCDVVLDNCFIIRDIKIIRGKKGPFISMPAKPITDRCPKCRERNEITARFCSRCGVKLGSDRLIRDPRTGKPILDQDIVHPINTLTREMFSKRLLEAYHAEVERRGRFKETPREQKTEETAKK
jgi:stage V sporulation protein G